MASHFPRNSPFAPSPPQPAPSNPNLHSPLEPPLLGIPASTTILPPPLPHPPAAHPHLPTSPLISTSPAHAHAHAPVPSPQQPIPPRTGSVTKRRFECPYCKKTFPKGTRMRTHMRIHTNDEPFQCGRCERRFKWKSSLTYHEKNSVCAPNRRRQHRCFFCDGRFASEDDLKMHRATTCPAARPPPPLPPAHQAAHAPRAPHEPPQQYPPPDAQFGEGYHPRAERAEKDEDGQDLSSWTENEEHSHSPPVFAYAKEEYDMDAGYESAMSGEASSPDPPMPPPLHFVGLGALEDGPVGTALLSPAVDYFNVALPTPTGIRFGVSPTCRAAPLSVAAAPPEVNSLSLVQSPAVAVSALATSPSLWV